MRTITLHITPDQMETMNGKCQADLIAAMMATDSRTAANKIQERADNNPVLHAIGRLSTWALPNEVPFEGTGQYDTVTITCVDAASPELVAVYGSSTHPAVRYVIGAVWHGDHFGFHS
jgi:hypothetical protein